MSKDFAFWNGAKFEQRSHYDKTKSGKEQRYLVRHKPTNSYGTDEQELHQIDKDPKMGNLYSRKTAARYANHLNDSDGTKDWDVVDHKTVIGK